LNDFVDLLELGLGQALIGSDRALVAEVHFPLQHGVSEGLEVVQPGEHVLKVGVLEFTLVAGRNKVFTELQHVEVGLLVHNGLHQGFLHVFDLLIVVFCLNQFVFIRVLKVICDIFEILTLPILLFRRVQHIL